MWEQEAKSQLSALEGKGVGLQMAESDIQNKGAATAKAETKVVQRSSQAVNYEDIDELIEEAPALPTQVCALLHTVAHKPFPF